MKASLEIYELKVLKGPDRLLRIHVIIKNTVDMKTSLEMLAELIGALIWKHHTLQINFPVETILDAIPEGNSMAPGKYGSFFNGTLGMEIVLMKQTTSSFKIRYYPEDLEFEREATQVASFLCLQKKTIDDYLFKYTFGDLRNGFEVPEILTKISYNKAAVGQP